MKKENNGNNRRAHYLKKTYGIDHSGFEAMWLAFLGKCGICGINMRMPLKQKGQPLDVVAIDHNHKTGNIRGLLCNKCNKGLGFFNDDPELLKKAQIYAQTSDNTENNQP